MLPHPVPVQNKKTEQPEVPHIQIRDVIHTVIKNSFQIWPKSLTTRNDNLANKKKFKSPTHQTKLIQKPFTIEGTGNAQLMLQWTLHVWCAVRICLS